MPPFLYWFLIIFEFFFVIGVAAYMLSLLYSSLMGSPYIPSKNKQVLEILKNIPFKKGMKLLDLGCGDGRIIILAAKKYGIGGLGIDINPLVVAWARFKTRLGGLKGIEFRVGNIFQTKISDFEVIYLFLMPKILAQLAPKLLKEAKKNALFISHGFKIEGWDKYCYKTLSEEPFPTYFYRLSR